MSKLKTFTAYDNAGNSLGEFEAASKYEAKRRGRILYPTMATCR